MIDQNLEQSMGSPGGACSAVLEQLARDLELVQLLSKLGQLAVDDFLPRSPLARSKERVDLGEREPDLAKKADDGDLCDGRLGVAPPSARVARRRSHQAKLVVIAQCRRCHATALGQLAD